MRYLILLILISSVTYGQKIKSSEYDKFSKTHRIETSRVSVKAGFSRGVSISYRSVGETIFLGALGYNLIKTGVNTDSKLIFLLKNDSTVTVLSKDMQFTDKNKYREAFDFEYYITKTDIEILSRNEITGVRLYGYSSYQDIEVEPLSSKKVNELSTLFLTEFDKQE